MVGIFGEYSGRSKLLLFFIRLNSYLTTPTVRRSVQIRAAVHADGLQGPVLLGQEPLESGDLFRQSGELTLELPAPSHRADVADDGNRHIR